MASARYATLCSPDALLHGSDLLHWQTLRCLSGLGLLHPEIFIVSRPALRRLPVFRQPSLGHQRNASPSSSADLLFGASQFCVSLPWVIKGSPHLRRQPTCSSAPPSFCVSLPWVIKGTPHPLRELETRKTGNPPPGRPSSKKSTAATWLKVPSSADLLFGDSKFLRLCPWSPPSFRLLPSETTVLELYG
jgi:hypothetical protein